MEPTILHELRTRGVSNPDEFAHLTDETIANTVRWFDAQHGRVGAGVLVTELRNGGRQPPPEHRDLMAEQRAYADEIVAWLREHFPDLDRPVYGPHPAAVTAVIRLHWLHGKGQLMAREHGPEIRAAVARWKEDWE